MIDHIRKHWVIVALVAAFVGWGWYTYPTTSEADTKTPSFASTHDWVYVCGGLTPSEDIRAIAESACLGYIRALIDTHNVMATLATGLAHPASSDISLMCVTSDVALGDAVKSISKWVNDNPDKYVSIVNEYQTSNRRFALIVSALNQAYPCSKETTDATK